MAHELEFVNGNASFAGRQPAWHQLGTVVEDLTFDEAIKAAHLADWNVRVAPLVAYVDGSTFDVPKAQVVVRDSPATGEPEVIAAVGDRYSPVQNEDVFAVVPFLEDGGAVVETAGSIRGGRQVFMALSTSKGFVIDPDGAADRVENFLLLSTSHDGSLAVEASSTPVRVVCANTLDIALPSAKRAYKVRHTTTAQSRLAEAQAMLLASQKYFEDFAKLATSLYKVPVSNGEFFDIISSFYEKPDSDNKRALTVWNGKIETLVDLWSGGSDLEYTLGNVQNTAWAAFNAMTERIDWHRTARGDKANLAISASGFVPQVTLEKQNILQHVINWSNAKKDLVLV